MFVFLDHASTGLDGSHSSAMCTFSELQYTWPRTNFMRRGVAMVPNSTFVAVSRDPETLIELARHNGAAPAMLGMIDDEFQESHWTRAENSTLLYKLGELKSVLKTIGAEHKQTPIHAVWVDLCAVSDRDNTLIAAANAVIDGGAIGLTLTCRCVSVAEQASNVKTLLRNAGAVNIIVMQYDNANGRPVIFGTGTVCKTNLPVCEMDTILDAALSDCTKKQGPGVTLPARLAKPKVPAQLFEIERGRCNRPADGDVNSLCTLRDGHLGPCNHREICDFHKRRGCVPKRLCPGDFRADDHGAAKARQRAKIAKAKEGLAGAL